jgi:DNA-binding winged helix-turn-helix (wHTH) protein
MIMATMSTLSPPGNCWIYQYGDLVVEPRAHRLDRAGQLLSVEPKVYVVLVALMEQAGTMLDRNTLLDVTWGHRNVTPGVLSRVIWPLRHALDDSLNHPRYIATVHCLGYRFIGQVSRRAAPPSLWTLSVPMSAFMDTVGIHNASLGAVTDNCSLSDVTRAGRPHRTAARQAELSLRTRRVSQHHSITHAGSRDDVIAIRRAAPKPNVGRRLAGRRTQAT